jgi:hypothetical protein
MKILILLFFSTGIQAFEWNNQIITGSFSKIKKEAGDLYLKSEVYTSEFINKNKVDQIVSKLKNTKIRTGSLDQSILLKESDFISTIPLQPHVNKFSIIKPYLNIMNSLDLNKSFKMINLDGMSSGNNMPFPMATPGQTQQLFFKLNNLKNNALH